jgi:hypothetical protein
MPFTASSASFGCPPRDKLDLEERYVVQVAALREKQMPSYDDANVLVPKMIWSFSVFRRDGSPVINAEGGIYTQDAITGVNVSPSRPGKPVAKARLYAEAVLGRDPKVAVDAGEDLEAALMGRFAGCLLDTTARTDGGTASIILKLSPIQDQKSVAGVVAAGVGAASLATTPAPVASAPAAAAAPATLPW